MISVRNLYMDFRVGARTLSILSDISFDLTDAEIAVIVGPSGSGKSTLLGLLAGLERPTRGNIVLDGTDITQLSEKEMVHFRRAHIGYVFQSFYLLPTLTALENVALPLELSGDGHAHRRAHELLAHVGLADRVDHYPVQLSGGEQQRVAIARAFAVSPPFLFADEPTGNLDSATGEHIIALLLELNRQQKSTLVLVTHDPSLARCATRTLVLKDGRIVSDDAMTLR
ncbi:MAG: ABC transporter ATP-binding protein [Nitrospirae bacterium]|nr:MAG: ABC transporter ATP-binding protein [Nitrospirota bacterium]